MRAASCEPLRRPHNRPRQLASLAVYGRGCVALLEEIAEEYRKLAG